MSSLTARFVFAKTELNISDQVKLEKNDVGVLETETDTSALVFFIRIWQKIKIDSQDFEMFNVKGTGDAYPKKVCNICHKLIDTTQFAKNQNAVNNRPVRRPSCNSCRKILEGIELSKKERFTWQGSKPDFVPFECPICKKRTIAGVTSKVVLDHNHITGKPRAWICDSCNTGIGRFRDDVAILQRAIEFLG